MSTSRYTPEQRAALIAVGEADERAKSAYRLSQLEERFTEMGCDKSQLNRALDDLIPLKLAKRVSYVGLGERGHFLTVDGRDECLAERE